MNEVEERLKVKKSITFPYLGLREKSFTTFFFTKLAEITLKHSKIFTEPAGVL